MKANEFIKKYGWCEAKKRLQFYDKTYPNVSRLQQELKPYVDAYDLVESYGGIDEAPYEVYLETGDDCYYNKELEEAIKLVEECS